MAHCACTDSSIFIHFNNQQLNYFQHMVELTIYIAWLRHKDF
ncbi:hypothetical protein PROFUN_16902 [Planoprotostelium fungivorum]|uniref:Uncharacterized protein n=1 Tax=Planoprotostelium fungivorum TaxID=1890364 RepID=A0A2P6MMR2_9EUKA|nr:hypothetical protein PROFUN_16902 [Planoprotostelium fungivorum]